MARWITRVRDLLTDEYPIADHEWPERHHVRPDGTLYVELFGRATQAQALGILAENAPWLIAAPSGAFAIIVRPPNDDDHYRVDFTTPGFVRP